MFRREMSWSRLPVSNCNITIVLPPCRKIGHIILSVCLFARLSVCMLFTLTSVITFEPYQIGTSYYACILNKSCPFKWHQGRWPCDLHCDFCDNYFCQTSLPPRAKCLTNTSCYICLSFTILKTFKYACMYFHTPVNRTKTLGFERSSVLLVLFGFTDEMFALYVFCDGVGATYATKYIATTRKRVFRIDEFMFLYLQ